MSVCNTFKMSDFFEFVEPVKSEKRKPKYGTYDYAEYIIYQEYDFEAKYSIGFHKNEFEFIEVNSCTHFVNDDEHPMIVLKAKEQDDELFKSAKDFKAFVELITPKLRLAYRLGIISPRFNWGPLLHRYNENTDEWDEYISYEFDKEILDVKLHNIPTTYPLSQTIDFERIRQLAGSNGFGFGMEFWGKANKLINALYESM